MRHRHTRHSGSRDRQYFGGQPVRGFAPHFRVPVDEEALGLFGDPHVPLRGAFGVSDNDVYLRIRAGQRERDAAGVVAGDILHAQPVVEVGIGGLGFDDAAFGQADQGVVNLLHIGGIAGLFRDRPVPVLVALKRGYGFRACTHDRYLRNLVEVAGKFRQQQAAAGGRWLRIVLRNQRQRAQDHQGGREHGHGTIGHDAFSARRRRLTTTADSATTVSSSGTSPMLMICSTVPSRSMLRSRLRCTARRSCRIRTCWSRNR